MDIKIGGYQLFVLDSLLCYLILPISVGLDHPYG